jgi:hypothetical protein
VAERVPYGGGSRGGIGGKACGPGDDLGAMDPGNLCNVLIVSGNHTPIDAGDVAGQGNRVSDQRPTGERAQILSRKSL